MLTLFFGTLVLTGEKVNFHQSVQGAPFHIVFLHRHQVPDFKHKFHCSCTNTTECIKHAGDVSCGIHLGERVLNINVQVYCLPAASPIRAANHRHSNRAERHDGDQFASASSPSAPSVPPSSQRVLFRSLLMSSLPKSSPSSLRSMLIHLSRAFFKWVNHDCLLLSSEAVHV